MRSECGGLQSVFAWGRCSAMPAERNWRDEARGRHAVDQFFAAELGLPSIKGDVERLFAVVPASFNRRLWRFDVEVPVVECEALSNCLGALPVILESCGVFAYRFLAFALPYANMISLGTFPSRYDPTSGRCVRCRPALFTRVALTKQPANTTAHKRADVL